MGKQYNRREKRRRRKRYIKRQRKLKQADIPKK